MWSGQITFEHFWQVILNLFLFSQGSPFFLLQKSQYLAFSNFLFGEGLRILKRDSPDFKIAFLTLDSIPWKLLKEQISTLHFIPDLIKASARFSKLKIQKLYLFSYTWKLSITLLTFSCVSKEIKWK